MSRRSVLTIGALLLAAGALSWKRRQFLASGEAGRPVVGVDRYALVKSYKVHYVDAGRGDALILIPGSFFTYHEWDRLLPLLADDFRLIAVDYVGVGQSDKPVTGFDYSVQAQGEIIYGLLDVLGIPKASVMGVSYGGSIALYMGARWPERINKVVSIEGFTTVEGVTLPWVDGVAGVLRTPLLGDLFIFLIQTGLLDGIRTAILVGQERCAPGERETEAIEKMIEDSSRSATRWAWYGIANARNTSMARYRSEPDLVKQLRVPVLELVGTESIFRKAIQPTLLALAEVPTARIVAVEGGGHDLQVQKPEVVARIARDFLAE